MHKINHYLYSILVSTCIKILKHPDQYKRRCLSTCIRWALNEFLIIMSGKTNVKPIGQPEEFQSFEHSNS